MWHGFGNVHVVVWAWRKWPHRVFGGQLEGSLTPQCAFGAVDRSEGISCASGALFGVWFGPHRTMTASERSPARRQL